MSKARSGGGRASRGGSATKYTKLIHPHLGILRAGDSVRLQAAESDPPDTELLARIEYFTRTPSSGHRDRGSGGGGGGTSAFLGFWYYRPTDVKAAGGGHRIPAGTHPRELFLSDHSDVNPTSSILERIDVWSAAQYEALLRAVETPGPSLPVAVLAAGYVCRLHYGVLDHLFELLAVEKVNALEVSARRHGRAPGMEGAPEENAMEEDAPVAAASSSGDAQADEGGVRGEGGNAPIPANDGSTDADGVGVDTGDVAGTSTMSGRSPPVAATPPGAPPLAPPVTPSASAWPKLGPSAAGSGGLPPGGAAGEAVPRRATAGAAATTGAGDSRAHRRRIPIRHYCWDRPLRRYGRQDGRQFLYPTTPSSPRPFPSPPPGDFAAALAALDPPLSDLPASERKELLVAHSFVSVALGAWLGPLGDTPVTESDLRRLFSEALRLYNTRVAPSS
ncbi:hypothetical protein MMPV_003358 [Pyropia vietnamensis]